jgi:hypothetical protein
MQQPFPKGDKIIDVVHRDGWIRVCVTGEIAEIYVDNITDVWIVVIAIQKAVAAGATKGTMFTGEVVNDRIAPCTRNEQRPVRRGLAAL